MSVKNSVSQDDEEEFKFSWLGYIKDRLTCVFRGHRWVAFVKIVGKKSGERVHPFVSYLSWLEVVGRVRIPTVLLFCDRCGKRIRVTRPNIDIVSPQLYHMLGIGKREDGGDAK